MRRIFSLIAFLTVYISFSDCQQTEDTLSRSGKIYLSLKNINFIKNNEYYSPVIEGYTLIGYFIQPALVYYPSEKIRLQLGTHLLSYSGTDKLSQAKLVFSTTYNFSKNTFLTLGTLNGSDKHRMLDPHFDKERLYNSYAEDGLQFVTENEHLFSDTWISWENFIFKGDTTREVFTAGESFRYASSKIADIIQVEVPVQIQFKHFGGQINNSHQLPLTCLNLAAGGRLNFDIDEKKFGTVGIEYLQFFNKVLTENENSVIKQGNASWFRFHFNYKFLYFGSYYWRSHNFFAPNGNAIYSSVSTVKDNLVIPDRKIWTNSLYLTFSRFKCLEIFLGFDAYYDPAQKSTDTAMTLHFNFEKLIRLMSVKSN